MDNHTTMSPMEPINRLEKLYWLAEFNRRVYGWLITHGSGDAKTVLTKMRRLESQNAELHQLMVNWPKRPKTE